MTSKERGEGETLLELSVNEDFTAGAKRPEKCKGSNLQEKQPMKPNRKQPISPPPPPDSLRQAFCCFSLLNVTCKLLLVASCRTRDDTQQGSRQEEVRQPPSLYVIQEGHTHKGFQLHNSQSLSSQEQPKASNLSKDVGEASVHIFWAGGFLVTKRWRDLSGSFLSEYRLTADSHLPHRAHVFPTQSRLPLMCPTYLSSIPSICVPKPLSDASSLTVWETLCEHVWC